MDLRSLRLDLQARQVLVVLLDAGGSVPYQLSGESAERVLQAAGPLLDRLGKEGGGTVQEVSIEPPDEVLSATCKGPVATEVSPLRRTGTDFRELAPLLRDVARCAAREARPRKQDAPVAPGPDADRLLWEQKYQMGGDGWELMRPAPPLARWVTEHPPREGTLALVVGCGRGHEARLWARAGAQVVAVDIAPTAVAETRRLAEAEGLAGSIEALQADLFDLPREHGGRYDLVLEHCCFCAIDPARRDAYVRAVHDLLKPGGHLLGLFWCHPYPGGPPYSVSAQEVVARFAPSFTLVHSEVPGDSVLSRSQQELLGWFTRRSSD